MSKFKVDRANNSLVQVPDWNQRNSDDLMNRWDRHTELCNKYTTYMASFKPLVLHCSNIPDHWLEYVEEGIDFRIQKYARHGSPDGGVIAIPIKKKDDIIGGENIPWVQQVRQGEVIHYGEIACHPKWDEVHQQLKDEGWSCGSEEDEDRFMIELNKRLRGIILEERKSLPPVSEGGEGKEILKLLIDNSATSATPTEYGFNYDDLYRLAHTIAASLPSSSLIDEGYWKRRCLAAEKFIEESPCDPDITMTQVAAHSEWQSIKQSPTLPVQLKEGEQDELFESWIEEHFKKSPMGEYWLAKNCDYPVYQKDQLKQIYLTDKK